MVFIIAQTGEKSERKDVGKDGKKGQINKIPKMYGFCRNKICENKQKKENLKEESEHFNQLKTKKEHQKQKIDTAFQIAFVYNELIKQERKPKGGKKYEKA